MIVVAVQVAGPWLCCCGPLRDLTAARGIATVGDKLRVAPTCPHCKTKESRPASDSQSTPNERDKHRSDTMPGQCPFAGVCWDSRLVTPLEFSDHDISCYLSTTVAATAFEPLVLIQNDAIDSYRTPDLPFLTTEARLYAHHALRC